MRRKDEKTPIGEWVPTQELIQNARDYWTRAGRKFPDSEAEEFLAYHAAHGSQFYSWPAAWKTWYVRALKFAGGPLIVKVRPVTPKPTCHSQQEPYTDDEKRRALAICEQLKRDGVVKELTSAEAKRALDGVRKGYWWATRIEERINEKAAEESKQAKRA